MLFLMLCYAFDVVAVAVDVVAVAVDVVAVAVDVDAVVTVAVAAPLQSVVLLRASIFLPSSIFPRILHSEKKKIAQTNP